MDQENIEQTVLSRRPSGWVVQYVQDVPIPPELSYAREADAWGVCVMKKWNELGDEPEWLRGTDQETHDLYYQDLYKEMGSAALTVANVEMDLVIYIYAQAKFYTFPCKPSKPPAELQVPMAFSIVFPENLN